MKTTVLSIGALVVAALVVTAGALAGGSASRAGSLNGAGATFPFPLISQWQRDYESKTGTKITYNPIGSGGGIAAITARTVDFGASDAPLTPDQLAACKGCVQIPWVLSSTSVVYNLPSAPNNLKLTGPILARIYLGTITRWNDAAIRRLNAGVALPDTKITPVWRSDGSGTTYNFTDYLSSVSGAFKTKVGNSTQVSWPTGFGGRGSSGLAGVVKNTEGAIGYVDVAYALTNRIKFARVQNRAGKFITPGLRAIAAAAATIKSVPAGNEMHIVDPPASQPLAYPISTFSYVLLPTRSNKAVELRRFVFYALTQGQKLGPKLLFQPIPKVVLVAAEKTLKQVQPAA
ncbi:MAG TPA: phosphate ABC transporter substrate-binding protein PstS [Gaiellaceae bacterium]|nr:phosphate ABC transporter substrate-binding protein PstS [Gaiellaceae bacterium]